MQTIRAGLKFAALYLLYLLAWAASGHAPEANAAEAPHQWSLILSWSPQYCDRHLSSKEAQCDGTHFFAPQWLSKVRESSDANCKTAVSLPESDLSHIGVTTSNRLVAQKRWSAEGACLGGPTEYFAKLDLAARRVMVPMQLISIDTLVKTTPDGLSQQFEQANPGLKADGLQFSCTQQWLDHVEICLDTNLHFARCSHKSDDPCGKTIKLRPNRNPR